VRAIIPPVCYERAKIRATRALIQATVLYAVPTVALVLTNTWWAVGIWWLLAGLAVSGLFVLGHDASHNALLDSRKANRIIAQLCMGPSVHCESAWDLGHNRIHHGYTTRQGFDFVWQPLTVAEYEALSGKQKLRHRLEWSCIGSGAYFLREVWWLKMWRFNAPGKRHDEIVRDKITLGSALLVATAAMVVIGALTGGIATAIWMPIKCWLFRFCCSRKSLAGLSTFTTLHQTFVGGLVKSGPSSTDKWNQPQFSTRRASSTISGFTIFLYMCLTTSMPAFRFTSCLKQLPLLLRLSQTPCVIRSIR